MSISDPNTFKHRISDSIAVKTQVLNNPSLISLMTEMADACIEALKNGKKIIFAGNGGSFADSIHLSAELIGRFKKERAPLASVALGANNSILTCIGNDYSFDNVFARELGGIGQEGDVLFLLSTSGNSKNILNCVDVAQTLKIKAFGWTGEKGGALAEKCKTFRVPSNDTARIQESHIMLGHIVCEAIELEIVKFR